MVNVPKTCRVRCRSNRCKKHTIHKVTQYKASPERLVSQGRRRYDRRKAGYGGRVKPLLKRKAKTTKKVVLRLECTKCQFRHLKVLKRCKKFELGAEKKSKNSVINF